MTSPAGERGPSWWPFLRRVITFVLGVTVIIDALAYTSGGRNMGELVVGLVMIGLLPLTDVVDAIGRARRPRQD